MGQYRFGTAEVAEHLPDMANVVEAEGAALHALRKHGPPTTDIVRAMGILTEELGEATQKALKATSGDAAEHEGMSPEWHMQQIRDEVQQIAGYALLVLRALDRNHYRLIPGDQP